MNELTDTIAAIATPPGAGGIGIVRVSGEDAPEIASRVFTANSGDSLRALPGYTARLGKVRDASGALLDEAVALVFHAPRSYTGEEVVEIMCHGGELVCAAVLSELLRAGARPAGRGEFTRRAYLCGRISLTEAEAVCELINAASAQGERAAAALATGALSGAVTAQADNIRSIQAGLAACMDFPEEDVEEPDAAALTSQLSELESTLRALADSADAGAQLMRGIPTAIVGSPNVGKSTLLNLLAGAPKARVTPIAGTTRDVVEQRVSLGGVTLILADTAGIHDSADEVERLGVELAIKRAGQASLLLAVFDASRPLDADDRRVIELLRGRRALAVINKTDLCALIEASEVERALGKAVYISANDTASLPALEAAVLRAVRLDHLEPDAPLLANERQRGCALRAADAVALALSAVDLGQLDAAFASLSAALDALAELTGENAAERVLDEVFSRFCVGK